MAEAANNSLLVKVDEKKYVIISIIIILECLIIYKQLSDIVGNLDLHVNAANGNVKICETQYTEGQTGNAAAVMYIKNFESGKYLLMMLYSLWVLILILVVYNISHTYNDNKIAKYSVLFVFGFYLVMFIGNFFVRKSQEKVVYFNDYDINKSKTLVLQYYIGALILLMIVLLMLKLTDDKERETTPVTKFILGLLICILLFTLLIIEIIINIKTYIKNYYSKYILRGVSYDVVSAEKNKLQNLALRLYYIAFPDKMGAVPSRVRNLYTNPFFTYFAKAIKLYFKNNIKYADGDSADGGEDELITHNVDKLWMYMLHNDGEELVELVQLILDSYPRTQQTSVDQSQLSQNFRWLKITADISKVSKENQYKLQQALTEITDIIISTRKTMVNIRRDRSITLKTRQIYIFSVILQVLIIFAFIYMLPRFSVTQSINLTQPGAIILVILIICLVTVIGIVNNALVH